MSFSGNRSLGGTGEGSETTKGNTGRVTTGGGQLLYSFFDRKITVLQDYITGLVSSLKDKYVMQKFVAEINR